MLAQIDRKSIRRRARYRIRKKISGTSERPRLAVFRSRQHIYVQAVDDTAGRTITQASTQDPEVRKLADKGWDRAAAAVVGRTIAERLKAAGINQAVLDRGGWRYHGRVGALATAAREAGLKL